MPGSARHKAEQCPKVKLTAHQQKELHRVAPNLKITAQLIDKLRSIVLDRSRSIGKRVKAMENLTGIRPKHPIHLNICIWDPVGRDGPIFTATVRFPSPGLEERLRLATGNTTCNIGGPLMLVALSVSFGGIVQHSGVMQYLLHHLPSIWAAMSLLVPIMIGIGMFMDPYGAIILVNSSRRWPTATGSARCISESSRWSRSSSAI